MANMNHLSIGFVVMGTMSPPSTTCGISAIGVSAMAASLEATTVDSMSPMATALSDVEMITASSMKKANGPPLKPSAKKTMPRSSVHWMMQKNESSANFESR